MLAYIAFALIPISRHERVQSNKAKIFTQYDDEKLQTFLDFILDQYIKEGVGELDQGKLSDLIQLRYGAIRDAEVELGGIPTIRDAFIGFQQYLYESEQQPIS